MSRGVSAPRLPRGASRLRRSAAEIRARDWVAENALPADALPSPFAGRGAKELDLTKACVVGRRVLSIEGRENLDNFVKRQVNDGKTQRLRTLKATLFGRRDYAYAIRSGVIPADELDSLIQESVSTLSYCALPANLGAITITGARWNRVGSRYLSFVVGGDGVEQITEEISRIQSRDRKST